MGDACDQRQRSRGPHVPCIRVCAPLEARIASLMERLDTDDEVFIREEIEKSDAAHAAAMHARFNVRWGDPLLYDLTLNTGRLSVETCIEQILALLKRPEFQETPASRAVLDNLALEAHVRAAFIADPRTEDVDVTVVAKGDSITLRGMVEDEALGKAAREVAHRVPGVAHVHSELRAIRRPRR